MDKDDLTCPITLGVFRDPVRATDGHVYERTAITRWIQEHGTSPLTREPLKIDELVPDQSLRELASARRQSTVSQQIIDETPNSDVFIETVSLPVGVLNSNRFIHTHQRKTTKRCLIGIALGVSLVIMVIIPIIIIVGLNRNNTPSNYSTVIEVSLSGPNTGFEPPYSDSEEIHYYGAFLFHIDSAGLYGIRNDGIGSLFGYIYINKFSPSSPYDHLLCYGNGTSYNQLILQYKFEKGIYILVLRTSEANVPTSTIFEIDGPEYIYLVTYPIAH